MIEYHVPEGALDMNRVAEESERETWLAAFDNRSRPTKDPE